MEIIGLDLPKRECQRSITAEDGTITDRRIATSPDRFTAVLGGRPPARILLEASTQSEWVASLGMLVSVTDGIVPRLRLAFPMRTIGLISDTHGLVRAEVLLALRGVDLILHAGDIGGADVLLALAAIAPVRAVRGDADVAGADPASADAASADTASADVASADAAKADPASAHPANVAGLEPRIDEKFEQVHVVVTHGHELVRAEPPQLVSAYMHADVIVYGHTRLPLITRAARRLIINPGAAGDAYLGTSPTVARLYIDGRQCDAQLMRLFPDDPDGLA